jgi:hypothetical protein
MVNASTLKPITANDIVTMAKTIYGEARGESLAGQIAVGYTITKRAQIAADHVARHGGPHSHYGDGSLAAVCKAPRQYDCWDPGDNNFIKLVALTLDDAEFQTALYAAIGVVQRLVPNTLPEATHYYNPKRVRRTPAWVTGVPAHDGKPAVPPAHFDSAIGNHRFYSQVPA